MPFVQFVIGPPGSGKSSYSLAARDYLESVQRPVCLVNLDPASDVGLKTSSTPSSTANEGEDSHFDVDIRDLVTVQEVMERMQLGPNGALVWCMEFLEKNLDWLKEQIEAVKDKIVVIIDCPGQVELYCHHRCMRNIMQTIENSWKYRCCCIHLVDSFMCRDAGSFLSALLVSLSAMMMLELPHINVLSKIDLLEAYGELPFRLDYYTEILDLSYLLDTMNVDTERGGKQYKALTAALLELVEDFALVQFNTLNVQSKESMEAITKVIDKANGYFYHSSHTL